MANQEHLDILKQGAAAWDQWREKYQDIQPDLSNTNLSKADLSRANLSRTNLCDANLSKADLSRADLVLADLRRADLSRADLFEADLVGANLQEANLSRADLSRANLVLADLSQADLTFTRLVGANLREATLINSPIYGIAAWDVLLEGAKQSNLIITLPMDRTITVSNLQTAQIMHLFSDNKNIEKFINSTTEKFVLILGRFTPERKKVLDVIWDELRKYNYLPILFDFKKPDRQDLTGTVTTLANLSRFIIADITSPRSVIHELATIIPHLRKVVVQPLLEESERPYAMLEDFEAYPWCLKVYTYKDLDDLLKTFKINVIDPAEKRANELTS